MPVVAEQSAGTPKAKRVDSRATPAQRIRSSTHRFPSSGSHSRKSSSRSSINTTTTTTTGRVRRTPALCHSPRVETFHSSSRSTGAQPVLQSEISPLFGFFLILSAVAVARSLTQSLLSSDSPNPESTLNKATGA
eukprot:INCI7201.4.p1 GENE.INCI7201.4~~INCI7201.4.p1  ORF type:complete len:135 (+),score=19.65 INCI7201.4:481-885(+)